MPSGNKRLRIMAGPNGSGKSTILQEVRKNFYSGPFVNADEIEKSFNEKGLVNLPAIYDIACEDKSFADFMKGSGKSWLEKATKENNHISIISSEGILIVKDKPSPYDAALAADFIRHQLLAKGETFTFETVLSHPSKIDFLKQSLEAGYKNYLYFICTVDPAINIERVQQRVRLGGHAVPEDRIEKRYHESLQVLPMIIPLCFRVYLFDNSSEERSIEPVAEIDDKRKLTIKAEQLPWWVQQYVIDPLYTK
jgi:predicted ABC-type ATPase